MNGTIRITFNQDDFIAGPNYRSQVLEVMLNYAAEFYLCLNSYGEVLETVLKGFPNVKAPVNGAVDTFFVTLYSQSFTETYEEALEFIRKYECSIFNEEPEAFTEEVMEAAQLFHQYGQADAATFASTYGHFFETTLDSNLYAPNYAFLTACEAAGFDLDKWAEVEYQADRLAWFGYFKPGENPMKIIFEESIRVSA